MIEFDKKNFAFPINVYTHLMDKKSLIALFMIIVMTAAIIIGASIITGDTFSTWLFIFVLIAFFTASYLYQKPRFIIEKDKLILTENGIIKPKTLYWKDCYLYAYEYKHHATGKIMKLMHFLYKDSQGELQRFATVNLNGLRFDEHHFDDEKTLQFFEQLVGQHKQ